MSENKKLLVSNWDSPNLAYHRNQILEPYRSSASFVKFLCSNAVLNKDSILRIADIGAGMGGNISYMAGKFRKCEFVGIDINEDLIRLGKAMFKERGLTNCALELGDVYSFGESLVGRFDGLVSFQTISWLEDYMVALSNMVKLNPTWIAFSSLFYDGPISCRIEVDDWDKGGKLSCINILSIPIIKEFFYTKGYKHFTAIPFEIEFDLEKPDQKIMKTYTEKLDNGNRLQMSGPLLFPWYFVLCSR